MKILIVRQFEGGGGGSLSSANLKQGPVAQIFALHRHNIVTLVSANPVGIITYLLQDNKKKCFEKEFKKIVIMFLP